MCLSLVVITGLAGQLSLSQYAMAGMAAWVAGRLTVVAGLPFPAAIRSPSEFPEIESPLMNRAAGKSRG